MEKLYQRYQNKVQFFLVYTREIHPTHSKEEQARGRRRPSYFGGPDITQHKDMRERASAAGQCARGLKLSLPFLVDSMKGTYTKTYAGMPAGTTVIGIDGRIAFWYRGSPWGCRPKEAGEAIEKLLAAKGAAKPKLWAPIRFPRPIKVVKKADKAGAAAKGEKAKPDAGGKKSGEASKKKPPRRKSI